MTDRSELPYAIALGYLPGKGATGLRKLLLEKGNARKAFQVAVSGEGLLAFPEEGAGDVISPEAALERARAELAWCDRAGVEVLPCTDPRYPRRLLSCYDAPYLLYRRGQADLNPARVLAVVGTRECTPYGLEVTERIVTGLASVAVTIVSGLARGIDGAAHKASREAGLPTVAVLAHGLDSVSPRRHTGLAREIVDDGGALVSEYPSGITPEKFQYPARNRIIAGMADAVLVTESAARGGALITAGIAHSYERDVLAVPGRAGDRTSEGCNRLLTARVAAPVFSAADVLDYLGWEGGSTAAQPVALPPLPPPESPEFRVLSVLQGRRDHVHFDEIAHLTNLGPAAVGSALLQLEMQGHVRSRPGNCFECR